MEKHANFWLIKQVAKKICVKTMRHVTGNFDDLQKNFIKLLLSVIILYILFYTEQVGRIINISKRLTVFIVFLLLTTVSFIYSIQQKRQIVTTVEESNDIKNFTVDIYDFNSTKVMQWVQYEYVYFIYRTIINRMLSGFRLQELFVLNTLNEFSDSDVGVGKVSQVHYASILKSCVNVNKITVYTKELENL